jgi:hypothetical protein
VNGSHSLSFPNLVLRDGRWLLIAGDRSLQVTDPVFTGELDRLATAIADADQAVAELRRREAR